jgi:hypothetical protein
MKRNSIIPLLQAIYTNVNDRSNHVFHKKQTISVHYRSPSKYGI